MSLKAELERWAAALEAYDAGDMSLALDNFQIIADSSKVLFNIGLIHATQGQHEAAVAYYAQAHLLDQYMAVSFFQSGVSYFLLGRYAEAQTDFENAFLYMRENQIIDYDQLGLKFRLYSAEILFNRGLCHINQGQQTEGMSMLDTARKEKQTDEHGVIDEAYAAYGNGFTVFSVPVGVLFRPSAIKLKNIKARNYLGEARLVAATEPTDAFVGFSGLGASKKRPNSNKSDDSPSNTPTSKPPPALKQKITAQIPFPSAGAAGLPASTLNASARLNGIVSDNDPVPNATMRTPPLGASKLTNTSNSTELKTPPRINANIPRPTRSNTYDNAADSRIQRQNSDASASSGRSKFSGPSYLREDDRDDAYAGLTKAYSPPGARMPPTPPDSQGDSPAGIAGVGLRKQLIDNLHAEKTLRRETAGGDDLEELIGGYSARPTTAAAAAVPIKDKSPGRASPQGQSRERVARWASSQQVSSPPQRPSNTDLPRLAIPNRDDALKRQVTIAEHSAPPTLRRKDTFGGTLRRNDSRRRPAQQSISEWDPVDMVSFRLKLHYDNEVRGMSIDVDTPYDDFILRLQAKFGLENMRLKYMDEDGVYVSIMDETDWDSAVDAAREHCPKGRQDGKLEVWVE